MRFSAQKKNKTMVEMWGTAWWGVRKAYGPRTRLRLWEHSERGSRLREGEWCSSAVAATCDALSITSLVARKLLGASFTLVRKCAGKPLLHYQANLLNQVSNYMAESHVKFQWFATALLQLARTCVRQQRKNIWRRI